MFPKLTKQLEFYAHKLPVIHHVMSFYYARLIQKEIEAAQLSSQDNILCIGGGFLPMTAYMLQRKINAQVTVIDNDDHVIATATRWCKNKCHGVEVLYADGQNVDLTNYSVIHIAKQVTPKMAVYQHIKAHLKHKGKVLMRLNKAEQKNFTFLNSIKKGQLVVTCVND